ASRCSISVRLQSSSWPPLALYVSTGSGKPLVLRQVSKVVRVTLPHIVRTCWFVLNSLLMSAHSPSILPCGPVVRTPRPVLTRTTWRVVLTSSGFTVRAVRPSRVRWPRRASPAVPAASVGGSRVARARLRRARSAERCGRGSARAVRCPPREGLGPEGMMRVLVLVRALHVRRLRSSVCLLSFDVRVGDEREQDQCGGHGFSSLWPSNTRRDLPVRET